MATPAETAENKEFKLQNKINDTADAAKARDSNSVEQHFDLQGAIPVIKEHLKSLQSFQHEAVEAMFSEETETVSSIATKILSGGHKFAKDVFVVETMIKTTTKIPLFKLHE